MNDKSKPTEPTPGASKPTEPTQPQAASPRVINNAVASVCDALEGLQPDEQRRVLNMSSLALNLPSSNGNNGTQRPAPKQQDNTRPAQNQNRGNGAR